MDHKNAHGHKYQKIWFIPDSRSTLIPGDAAEIFFSKAKTTNLKVAVTNGLTHRLTGVLEVLEMRMYKKW